MRMDEMQKAAPLMQLDTHRPSQMRDKQQEQVNVRWNKQNRKPFKDYIMEHRVHLSSFYFAVILVFEATYCLKLNSSNLNVNDEKQSHWWAEAPECTPDSYF